MKPNTLKAKDKNKICVYVLSFILPASCMIIIYALFKVYPFGDRTILAMDMDNQYGEFFAYFHRVLTGRDSLLYSFTKEMGGSVFGLFTYYLSSPFSLLMIFFPQKAMPIGLALITVLKIGACGLTFAIFLRHVFKRCDISTILFSCCYALMSYSMMYSMCIMWLDAVIWLPIVLLGIERVLKGRSPLLFIASFVMTLFSNYYTAYMTAIFSVIYYLYRYFTSCREKNVKDFMKKILTMLGAGVVCVLLCSVVLLPTLLNMLNGKLAGNGYVADGFWNQEVFKIPKRLFMGQYDSMLNNGAPSIFCGMLCGVLIGVYFLNPKIKLKAKIAAVLVFAVFIVSFFIKKIDMAWHVFKYPNWFPYRYAYAFCFFSIYIAYSGFTKLKKKQLPYGVAGAAVYAALIVAVYFLDSEVITDSKLAILSLVFAGIYITILPLYCLGGKKFAKCVSCALVILTCAELIINGWSLLKGIDRQFGYTSYIEYRDEIDGIGEAVNCIKGRDDGFYRAEKTFLRTDNDNMSFGLKGITHYSSTYNNNIVRFDKDMGMRQEYIAIRYQGSTILTDTLLGIKYIISKGRINDSYKLVEDFGENKVYENPYAMGIGFAADNDIQSNYYNAGNALDNENYFTQKLLGNFVFKNVTRAQPADSGRAVEFTASETGMYYVDFAKNYNGVPQLTVNGASRAYTYDTGIGKKIFYLGRFNAGDRIKVSFTDYDLSKNARIAMVDIGALERALENIPNEKRFNVTDYSNTRIEGDVELDKDEILFTSIPYEDGWSVYVDGKKTEPVEAQTLFMAIPSGEGKHHIKLKYHVPGLRISAVISLLTLAGVLLFALKPHVPKDAWGKIVKKIGRSE